MHEVNGNLWEFDADFRCITTNGFVKNDGTAVMGRGCALEAKRNFPGIDETLGHMLKLYGNHVHELGFMGENTASAMNVLSFPVKHHWREKADLVLIERSAKELRKYMDYIDNAFEGRHTVVVPRPGCGNGQLSWEEVKPVIEPHFDDRFYVITF
jgi:hypothetical protein